MDITHNPACLYKRGVKGEVRVWRMEEGETSDGRGAHRVVSGIKDGSMTESGWTITEPKNVGRSNATTSKEQARAEIDALYDIKLARGYFYSETNIDEVPFTKPMLAQDWDKRKAKVDVTNGVFAQPKLDGIRCIARADGLWTRTGKPITALPHLHAFLAPLFDVDPEIVLDGELYNHDLRDDFNTITSIVRKVDPSADEIETARATIQYHIYDLPSHEGAFSDRLSALASMIVPMLTDDVDSPLRLVETIFADSHDILDERYGAWTEAGYEGQMVRINAPYENKRSNTLMKRKEFESAEFKVGGVHEGVGNWMGYAKRFTFLLEDGRSCGAGVRGTQAALKELLEAPTQPDWCTVRSFARTPDGMPRFPVVTDWGWGERVD